MAKSSVIAFLILISQNVSAQSVDLVCEGWFQKTGETLKRSIMIRSEQTHLSWKRSIEISGYKFEVDYDINLDSLYTTITKDGRKVLFTTARVPTQLHNDSFTDMNLEDGTRLAVSCSFKN